MASNAGNDEIILLFGAREYNEATRDLSLAIKNLLAPKTGFMQALKTPSPWTWRQRAAGEALLY
jgi:hypothetical protein